MDKLKQKNKWKNTYINMIILLNKHLCLILFLCVLSIEFIDAQATLSADGPGDTYELITDILAEGYNPVEVPDCGHSNFGRHIDEIWDTDLGSYVFRFHAHVDEDDDRCINSDRQRIEIKTYNQSADSLKAVEGETVVYKWKFKLDDGFQPSSSFTHLHQIKAVGGPEVSMPKITLTARKSNPNRLELRYAQNTSQVTLTRVDLAPFEGEWVEATETILFGENGTYSIQIQRISDGLMLLDYSEPDIRMWNTDAEFLRPKWGIYRSLNNAQDLRDEIVSFADFVIHENPPTPIDIEISLWLEGAYDTTAGEMTTLLHNRGLLPGQTPTSTLISPTPAGQPYAIAPWNYTGTEGEAWADNDYIGNETDWVLVSFRTNIAKDTEIAMTAGLLQKDGTIRFPNRAALLSNAPTPLYIIVEHRNHIGIMSPIPVDILNDVLTYDFRVSDSYRDPTSFGQKQLAQNTWSMYAGDADQSDFPSYDIQGTDKTIWFDNNGIFDYYLSPDFNLDGDVNGQDKSLWFDNNGISSRVPR